MKKTNKNKEQFKWLNKEGLVYEYIIGEKQIKTKIIPKIKNISVLFNNIDLLVDLHDKNIYLKCASPPLLILESMACETKVISTKMGEISEFLEDSINGFLIKNNNSKNIYKTIKKALNAKISIGKNARRTIVKKYDIKKVILKYEKVYKTIINS